MNNKKFRHLKASTLIETIVAMLIITIIFSLAFVMVLNIGKNANNIIRTKAYIMANAIWQETEQEKAYFDQKFIFRNITIKRNVIEEQSNSEIIQVNLSVFDKKGFKLFEKNRLLPK